MNILDLFSLWWFWFSFAFLLLVFELLLVNNFFLIFFSLGAFLTGLLSSISVLSSAFQLFVFSLSSLISLFLFRKKLLATFYKKQTHAHVDSFINESGCALDDILPNMTAKIELRGTSWNAKNVGDKTIYKGGRCVVKKVEGLTLHVHIHV